MTTRTTLLAMLTACLSFGQYKPDPKIEPWIVLEDPQVAKTLKEINSLTAYQTPNLPLKIDTNYGNTPEDVEPYGGVKPYKRHFLTQMEYTGAGSPWSSCRR